MLFKAIKNSLLSTFLLIGGTIVFLFIVYWLFPGSLLQEPIKENLSFSNITNNISYLVVIFFIVLAYIIFRVILEVKEKKAIEQLNKQFPGNFQAQKTLKKEWFVYKIAIFITFLFIMIFIFAWTFVFSPLYKMGV